MTSVNGLFCAHDCLISPCMIEEIWLQWCTSGQALGIVINLIGEEKST